MLSYFGIESIGQLFEAGEIVRKGETEQLSLHAGGRIAASDRACGEAGDAEAVTQDRGEMTAQLRQQRAQLADAVADLRQILFIAHGQREYLANPAYERRIDRKVVDRHREPAPIEVFVEMVPQGLECHLNAIG